ncbi:MAG: hypothetical protein EHM70_11915, partial [Chloroflexota bacterium]
AIIQLNPSTVGFELDLESMLAVADLERTRQPFWSAFWNFLWGSTGELINVPLIFNYSEERLRTYLAEELASRYDRAPTPSMPVAGTTSFQQGSPGTSLDIDRSVLLIEAALQSPGKRVVDLPLQRTTPSRPSIQNLEILLRQTIDSEQFNGMTGLYLLDLQTAQEINFLYDQGVNLPTQPETAFNAINVIKIPIMVSVFKRLGENPDPEVVSLIEEMIVKSGNTPADRLMEELVHETYGPLEVTNDMRSLGFQNTFLAGYFFLGAPLLETFHTPANQNSDRTDSSAPLSQTTTSEIGMLMADIYQCAQNGGGALIAAFPGEITQAECQTMMKYLSGGQISILIQAGVPEGTTVAHKHGWVQDAFGVIHDMSDAGIVFTPGGTYVLSIFLYHPEQLVWDNASKLVSDLSKAVYNYYNVPQP